MKQGLLLIETPRQRKPTLVAAPAFLVKLEPWHKTFFRNLTDLFRFERRPPLRLVSRPGTFWPDVFVSRRLPWGRFLQSSLGHILLIVALCGWARLWPQRAQIVQRPMFHSSDVVYYEATEYLSPLDTRGATNRLPMKGKPEHAVQPIISVPPESDNRTQTVVAPPQLKLDHDVPLPNIVAWGRPQLTIPLAVTNSLSDVKLPVLPTSVVAPPPDVRSEMKRAPALTDSVVAPAPQVDAAISRRNVFAPQPAIVEPPQQIENAVSRRLTDINIGHAQVVQPAPQLPVSEQHTRASMSAAGTSIAAVPPPPSIQGSRGSSNGRIIALNLHPLAPAEPVNIPTGNRRGTFAATPEGKTGAPGTPDVVRDNRDAAASGIGSGGNASGAPPGLFVGASPKPDSRAVASESAPQSRSSDNSQLLASATSPRVSAVPRR